MPLTRNDEEAIFEYGCHEGNLAMPNLLSAARAAEAAGGVATDDGIGDAETPATRASRTERAAEPPVSSAESRTTSHLAIHFQDDGSCPGRAGAATSLATQRPRA